MTVCSVNLPRLLSSCLRLFSSVTHSKGSQVLKNSVDIPVHVTTLGDSTYVIQRSQKSKVFSRIYVSSPKALCHSVGTSFRLTPVDSVGIIIGTGGKDEWRDR